MDVLLARWWRLIEWLGRVERALGVLLLSTIVVSITLQVVTRYLFGQPLVWVEEQPHVFRLAEDGRVDRVAVQAVLEDRWSVEPAEGLAEGDRIVVAGQAGLKHRALVRVVGEEDAAPETVADGGEGAAADTTPRS